MPFCRASDTDAPILDSNSTADFVANASALVAFIPLEGSGNYSSSSLGKKRQGTSTTIISFYQHNGNTGSPFSLDPTFLAIPDLSAASWQNTISSLGMIRYTEYVCQVFTSINYGGTKWPFRSPVAVYELLSYGLNDNINSLKCTYVGTLGVGAVIYQDNAAQGKSNYLPQGNYASAPQMTSTAWGGSFSNDALTSLLIYPGTQVILWENNNFLGVPMITYSNSPNNSFMYVDLYGTNMNDKTSSLIVTAYTGA